MARAALGVRRELSYLTDDVGALFASWPSSEVPANHRSVLMVFSTHPAVADYDEVGQVFGANFTCGQMI